MGRPETLVRNNLLPKIKELVTSNGLSKIKLPLLKKGALLLLLIIAILPSCHGSEREIDALILAMATEVEAAQFFFGSEPLVNYVGVPFRLDQMSEQEAIKSIRMYFPRSYAEMRGYDVIMLCSPNYELLSTKQDQWMYNAIQEGTGGINTASVLSYIPKIHWAWANSHTSKAFPNQAMAVAKMGGGLQMSSTHFVEINRDFPEPVLTPFIPFGVEKIPGNDGSRLVLAREGAKVLAWQIGNHYQGKVDYLVAWDYGEGRTMTIGELGFGRDAGWFDYRQHEYAPDILMNMVFYMSGRDLIEDVALFHRLKTNFLEFRTRMMVLTSLMDFVAGFGGNTQQIQEEILKLDGIYDHGVDLYLDQNYEQCEEALQSGLQLFYDVEDLARRVKDSALLWVYVIEWLVTSSAFFFSGFVLWTLMVKRRMYREVRVTKLR